MSSIKRNSRTNLILDCEQKGCEGKDGGQGGGGREEMKWATCSLRIAQTRIIISRSVSADVPARATGNEERGGGGGVTSRKHRLFRIGGRPRIVIFTTSARQKKRLFAMVRCAAMTVVRVKLVTMLPRRRPLRIDRSYG